MECKFMAAEYEETTASQEGLQFLLCDVTGRFGGLAGRELGVTSPIQCLDRAVEENPEIIVWRFGCAPLWVHEWLVELVSILKRNSHTRSCNILALLQTRHRQLLQRLVLAGLDYVEYTDSTLLEATQIQKFLQRLGPDNNAAHQLEKLCPYLRYSRLKDSGDFILCGAYLERMVLGGTRLHKICETENHCSCEYFMNPRRLP